MNPLWILLFLPLATAQTLANDNCADVFSASASQSTSTGLWSFSATISSPYETGWDQYADEFLVRDPAGNTLATRILAHPHQNEQPFTRSVSGVSVDTEDTPEVVVVAKDSINGYCGEPYSIFLIGDETIMSPTALPVISSSLSPSQVPSSTAPEVDLTDQPISTGSPSASVLSKPQSDQGAEQNQLPPTGSPEAAEPETTSQTRETSQADWSLLVSTANISMT